MPNPHVSNIIWTSTSTNRYPFIQRKLHLQKYHYFLRAPKNIKIFWKEFYWIRDRIKQVQIELIWGKVVIDMADYFTKHHPPWNHKKIWYKYLQWSQSDYLDICTLSACKGVFLPTVVLTYLGRNLSHWRHYRNITQTYPWWDMSIYDRY